MVDESRHILRPLLHIEKCELTAFLTELLSDLPVKLTRPALGLPAGANLSYADSATIGAALAGRTGV